jgi:glycosyltransferase involved in cell wall biosynthesis
MTRISFVTNFCPHYRVKTFELLAKKIDVDYFFFSEGSEWYWQKQHGVHRGNFRSVYLPGFSINRSRISPLLPFKLWSGRYDIYIKCIDGRFALLVAFVVARLRGKPFILWTGIWARVKTLFHKMFFPITRFIYLNSDAIVVYGEHVKNYLITEGVPEHKIFVAPHAVDNKSYDRVVSAGEKADLRRKLNIDQHKKIILFLGRVEEAKGLSYLLDAFRALNRDDAILIVAGEGSFKSSLEDFVRTFAMDEHVRFTGFIPAEQTTAYYSIADVYVLPSISTKKFKEPWGLVINEAFNQGVPVIVTEAVGAAAGGLVQHGVNGFVVRERDAAAIADAIKTVLDHPSLRLRLSRSALEIISSWDNDRMVEGFCNAVQFVRGKPA